MTSGIRAPMIRLGVLGWPVSHSRSPAMHNAALAVCGLRDWHYGRLPVPPELFAETVRALPNAGFRGVNVTIPHKAAALALSSDPSESARAIGAANTLIFENGAIVAENTDAPALISALPWPIQGRQALVMGAGGSARAAIWALLDAGAAEVRVWNRTPERAQALCTELGGEPVGRIGPADVLINCTSSGMKQGESSFRDLPMNANDLLMFQCVVDFVYVDTATALTLAAREGGLDTVDGLELLVGQGALSFERFTGRPAPVSVMHRAVLRA